MGRRIRQDHDPQGDCQQAFASSQFPELSRIQRLEVAPFREPNEHAREHIECAKLVPLSRFQAEDFAGLRDKTAVFHCHSGGRTTANAQLLTSKGFRDAYQLAGGIVAWKAAGLPTRSQQQPAGEGRRKLFGLF